MKIAHRWAPLGFALGLLAIPAPVAAQCTITCPANITTSNDPNQCGAVVNYPPPSTTGVCGTIVCSPASGSFFPTGPTTQTCTTSAGPSCSFSITVVDTQPPSITCPANISRPAVAPAVVNYSIATSSDNCPGLTVAGNPPSGSTFPLGQTTVTQTGTDSSGNTATCSFFVNLNTGAITGRVYNDLNRNATLDAGELGLPGVGIQLDGGADNSIDAVTFTDSTGRFGFFGLASGVYRVRQALPAGMLQTTAQPADVSLTSVGQQVVLADMGDFAFSVRADFDGDRKTDLVVYRPASGTWFWLRSNSAFTLQGAAQWGNQGFGDVPIGGDIDGDRIADLVVWRASTGTWLWLTSSTGYAVQGQKQWGNQALGDVPMLADMDGDRLADLVVWRASTGTWYWLTSSSGYDYAQAVTRQWGNESLGDIPLIGEFDGDLKGDVAVWRASTGTWYWLTSSSGYNPAASGAKQWGNQGFGDKPFLADLGGDGKSDLAVWRPGAPAVWYWLQSGSNYAYEGQRQQALGTTGDVPALGDFDSDGRADLTTWRPGTGNWTWRTSSSNFSVSAVKQWGAPTDIPMIK
jgi:uncharacterized protein (DUF2141 family)